jgi:hypothetical protein
MNEFFTCPSYTYGGFIIGIITMMIMMIMYPVLGSGGNSIISMVSAGTIVAWLFYNLYKFFVRSPECERIGFPEGNFRNPFS